MAKWSVELEVRWRELTDEVIIGMKEWRLQHPKAALREIEAALDERLNKVRARMLEDAALASAAADLTTAGEDERPLCATCGGRLEAHGQEKREVTTTGNQTIRLTRTYAVCPACGAGLFPPR
jgi:YgiT-type zinc finger domain-containing protein